MTAQIGCQSRRVLTPSTVKLTFQEDDGRHWPFDSTKPDTIHRFLEDLMLLVVSNGDVLGALPLGLSRKQFCLP